MLPTPCFLQGFGVGTVWFRTSRVLVLFLQLLLLGSRCRFRAPIWSNKELNVTENLRRTLNQTLETEVLSGSWDLVTKALAPVKKQLMFREGGGLDFLFLKRTFF